MSNPVSSAPLSFAKQTLIALESLQARLDASERARNEPIAIIGMGCRFPGGIDGPESFWELLRDGKNAISELPAARRAAEGAKPKGGYLDNVDGFDAAFFGISPREAITLDPQQRLALEVSWEALEHAGKPPDQLSGSQTGVYIGTTTHDYLTMQAKGDSGEIDSYFGTGTSPSLLSGRVSYFLGLHGPSITVDTACSSSLVTVHLASQALRAGECNLALAGGVNLLLSPELTVYFTKIAALAPDGQCKAFDASADGFVRSEGCGMVVLKRLSDALADGDEILAVVRGSAVNQDGRSNGLTAPNLAAQEAVIRKALSGASVSASAVEYVEAHGSGTPLGDPIEVRAISAALRPNGPAERPLWIGSVKSNFGHTEATAGIAGLMKVVLALRHGQIPAHLHFRTPNPHVAWDEVAASVAASPVDWPARDVPRHAGVSSFGISGTNAHAILSDAPRAGKPPAPAPPADQLLTLSARSAEAVRDLAASYCDLLSRKPEIRPYDLCASAALYRSHHNHRLAIAGRSLPDFQAGLASDFAAGHQPAGFRRKIVFVFSGHGSQWDGMAQGLLETEPEFRKAIEECDRAIQAEAGWSVLHELLNPARQEQVRVIQPLLFAIQIGLARLWRSLGIEPDAVIGHSMGEVAAACIAGALSLEDAAQVICRRSELLQLKSGQGAMAVVELSQAEAEHAVADYPDRLSVAVINGPRTTVIAGEPRALAELVAKLEIQAVFCRPVKTDVAFHTAQMDSLVPGMLSGLRGLQPRRASIPFYSTVRGRILIGTECDSAYWAANLREPVLFWGAVRQLAAAGHDLFLEVSPHPILLPAIEEGLRSLGHDAVAVASLRRDKSERAQLLAALGRLYTAGCQINWAKLYPVAPKPVTLPNYPWQRERFWLEKSAAARPSRREDTPLLGPSVRSSLHAGTTFWEIDAAGIPWLKDHSVFGETVFPAAGFVEIALEAATDLWGPGGYAIENAAFLKFAVIPEAGITLQIAVAEEMSGAASFRISSRAAGQTGWTLHVSGRLVRASASQPAALPDAHGEARTPEDHYRRLSEAGLNYGPAFRGIASLITQGDKVFATITAPEENLAAWKIHPALLDAAFQTLLASPTANGGVFVPTGLDSLRLLAPPESTMRVYAKLSAADADTFCADLTLGSRQGHPVLEIKGLKARRIANGQETTGQPPAMYHVAWQPHAFAANAGLSATPTVFLADPESNQQSIEASCLGLLDLVRSLTEPTRLFIVTRGACKILPHDVVSPAHASLWGLGRTLALEDPALRTTLIDLDPAAGAEQLSRLIRTIDSEDQIALRGNDTFVARLTVADETQPETRRAHSRPWRLETKSAGVLDNLHLRETTRQAPAPGQVEIEVTAAGINFLDILGAMGARPDQASTEPLRLGYECAGRVVRVGAGLMSLRVGDAVVAVSPNCLASHVTVPETLAARYPGHLTIEEAASIPVAWVTAWYALERLARIRKGESVLIHSAAGGVGLAAVAIARRAGAQIFATAGTEEKRTYLRSLGIEHVMDSRSLAFTDEILHITGGRGVDVVLNSLTGEAVERGIAALAPCGRFLEIGKKDIYENRQIGLLPFRKNLSYFAIDLAWMAEGNPEIIGDTLREVLRHFEDGSLHVTPLNVFPVSRVAEAFHLMAQGRNTGKIVVTADADAQVSGGFSLDPNGTYLITGGLGALGLTVAQWMAGRGAQNLVLLGRSEPSPSAVQTIVALRERGVNVAIERADISDESQLARLLQDIGSLRGIVHAAGIVSDAPALDLDPARFRKVMDAKIQGAWNLHLLTQSMPLDFFVLFSSAAATLGSPGQANYACANAFMDGLAHLRRGQNLPAQSIAWGPWSEIGMAAGRSLSEKLAAEGIASLTPAQGIAALERAILQNEPHVAILKLDATQWCEAHPGHDARLLAGVTGPVAPRSAAEDFPAVLRIAAAPARRALIETKLREIVAQVLRLPVQRVDTAETFGSHGFDSLMALEFRNRLQSLCGVSLPATLVWNYPTIPVLAEHLAGLLNLTLEAAEPEPQFGTLTDTELASLLEDELADLGFSQAHG